LNVKYALVLIMSFPLFAGFIRYTYKVEKKIGSWSVAQNDSSAPEPWTARQLMAPADLATTINNAAGKKPLIICVGPGSLIKGSINIGPAKEKQNLVKLKKELTGLPKDRDIVIYCGCCPFDHCPNIRPAFTLLNEMKFSNAHLLNLEHNIKLDWVDKGYPQEKL
jgi:thiosulfate/3-mercaptopyruvate sulfurtransferase